MRHETTKGLYRYWNALRGERLAPRRFEIEPSRIGDFLPETFILERVASDNYPFRLAGTRLADRMSFQLRGRNVFDCFAPGDGITVKSRLNSASVQGGVILMTLRGATRSGRHQSLEMIVLPLLHMQPTADRYLGAICPIDPQTDENRDLVTGLEITADEIIWPDGRPHSIVESVDRQVPFLPHIRTARIVRQDRRQFRVYDGGLGKSPDDHHTKR
ncbi:MAG: PAS domain-containing protein [Hyphomicrobium sp.]|nr:PAS domain-containing protein [Hyphomicrobium sp.]